MDPLQIPLSERIEAEVDDVAGATLAEDKTFLRVVFHVLNLVSDCKAPSVAGWAGDRGHAIKLREATNLVDTVAKVVNGSSWRSSLTSSGWKEFVAHLCALYALLKHGSPGRAARRLAEAACEENDQLHRGMWAREKQSARANDRPEPKLDEVFRKDVSNQARYDKYVSFFEYHTKPIEETVGEMLMAVRQSMSTETKPNEVVALKGTLPVEPGHQTEAKRAQVARDMRAKEADDDDWL
mgnify:FL=1